MTAPHWEGAGVTLHHGDSIEVLRAMPDASVDSVVTDPPYGLAELGARDVAAAMAAWLSGDRTHVPDGRGFMGRSWDRFVPPPGLWDECMRVLKPGGHLLAFAGSRTADLMGISIRLAGFEIRDTITWHYGSGFPKSLDVSKAIDRQRDDRSDILLVAAWLAARRDEAGWDNRRIDALFGFSGMAGHWTARPDMKVCQVPRWDQWCVLKESLGFGDDMDAEVWRLNGRKGAPGEAWQNAEVLRTETRAHAPSGLVGVGQDVRDVHGTRQIKAPATDDSRRWSGWGTALKPASEPIVVARKPLTGTVAQTVLTHGTGALNIDGCRVATSDDTRRNATGGDNGLLGTGTFRIRERRADEQPERGGRWPTNVVFSHAATPDGEDLCADGCVPGCPVAELDGQSGTRTSGYMRPEVDRTARQGDAFGQFSARTATETYGDSGGASRFFPTFRYEAKAPSSERPRIGTGHGSGVTNNRCALCGRTDVSGSPCVCPEPEWIPRDGSEGVNAHPTVKPVALMRWLVRLVTPPGGTVLDPFAGSGTTGEACIAEGFTGVLIELEANHLPLIIKRLSKGIQINLDF